MERDLATEETTVALWRLGRYTLREKIGAGGMGVVHRALDGDGHEVAIKLLHPQVAEDGDSRERFAREVRALSRVRGHHVAEVLDADIAASTPYLVTKYVAGSSLQDVVAADGPLRGPALEALAADLIDALASIHEAGIVHRDLKPANVLVCGGEAYVIDFGIAQIGDDTRLTVPGMVFGTPGYLAPELLAGGDTGSAGDVFAWGATVAFAASGRPPFGTGRFDVVSYAVVHKEPALTGVPGWLAGMLRKALAKDPDLRPTVAELRDWAAAVNIDAEPEATPGERVFDWARDAADDWGPESSWAAELPTDNFSAPAATARLPVHPPRQQPEPPEAPAQRTDWPTPEQEPEQRPAPVAPFDAGELGSQEPGEKHRIIAGLLLLALAAAAVVFPAATGLVTLCWLIVSRTIDRAASVLENRRALRGRRASDVPVAIGALPWQVVRSFGITALVLAVAVIGVGVIVGFVALFSYASSIALPLELVYAGALLLIVLFALYGFQHEPVRRGTRRLIGAVAGTRELGVTFGLVLTVGIVIVAILALVGYVSYWPLDALGFDPSALNEAWRSLTVAG